MKKIFTILIACATLTTSIAQITAPVIEEKSETDNRYMAGAVPEVDGKVVLTRTVDVPAGLTLQEVMNRVDAWLIRCTKDERMHYNQRLPQTTDNELQHSYSMELTFSKSFLAHDFAEMAYVLAVRYDGGQKKTKLIFGFKKFRMKTIDLLDELQISLQNEFK